MTDTTGQNCFLLFLGWVVSALILLFVVAASAPPGSGSLWEVAAVLLAPGLVFGPPMTLGAVVAARSPVNIGPTVRFGDSRVFRALRWAAGVRLVPCGCLCAIVWHSADVPTTETLDETEIWVRERDGAKIRYTSGQEQFVRCTHCGNRYLQTRKHSHSRHGRNDDLARSEFWEDDPDPTPDSYPEDGREIMEAES